MFKERCTYGYIYMIENLKTGQRYIGAKQGDPTSINVYHGSSRLVTNDISEFGINKFKKYILDSNVTMIDDFLNDLEAEYIKEFKTHISQGGYNIIKCGGTTTLRSDEARNKMSISGYNKPKMTDETKAKISKGNIGRIVSMKTRNKISNTLMGNEVPKNVRIKISDSMMGRTHTKEAKENMSIAQNLCRGNGMKYKCISRYFDIYYTSNIQKFCYANNISRIIIKQCLNREVVLTDLPNYAMNFIKSNKDIKDASVLVINAINSLGWKIYEECYINDNNVSI